MANLTPEGLRVVSDIASRHGFSRDAALSLVDSLSYGNGFQAQFNHPELGGMGQWSQGGMIMIGDMFNQGLKYRVDGLCNDLSALLREQPSIHAPAPSFSSQSQGGGASLFIQGGSGSWWPSELGQASSSGAQNDMRYAFFPGARRLAIQRGGSVTVYDTGDHQLGGFSQQQSGDQSMTFTSQYGVVRVADLPVLSGDASVAAAPAFTNPPPPAPTRDFGVDVPTPPTRSVPSNLGIDEILKIIEGLASLRQKDMITEEEFATKKAELLGRI
jgi:hypothetical protein